MRVGLRVEENTYGKISGFLRRVVKRAEENKDAIAQELAEFVIDTAKDTLEENENVISGTLIASLGYDKVDEGVYEVYADAPYAKFIEYGRGDRGDSDTPFPPQENINPFAIQRWVSIKFGLDYDSEYTRSLTFRIINVLKTEGQYSYPFLRPSVRLAKTYLREYFGKRGLKLFDEGVEL